MGTKASPGSYDCYTKAAADEPLFTLLARDPLAPGLVKLWAALRDQDCHAAETHYAELLDTAAAALEVESPLKIDDAYDCAAAMAAWRTAFAVADRPQRCCKECGGDDAPVAAEYWKGNAASGGLVKGWLCYACASAMWPGFFPTGRPEEIAAIAPMVTLSGQPPEDPDAVGS